MVGVPAPDSILPGKGCGMKFDLSPVPQAILRFGRTPPPNVPYKCRNGNGMSGQFHSAQCCKLSFLIVRSLYGFEMSSVFLIHETNETNRDRECVKASPQVDDVAVVPEAGDLALGSVQLELVDKLVQIAGELLDPSLVVSLLDCFLADLMQKNQDPQYYWTHNQVQLIPTSLSVTDICNGSVFEKLKTRSPLRRLRCTRK